MRYLLAALVVFSAIGLAFANADGSDLDTDIVLSDMPLAGEHQANDMGSVIILIVETCNGKEI